MDWPNIRKSYTGVGNPIYISDIVELTQNVLAAMKAVLGLGASDFYIISGMEYDAGAHTYAVGIVYINGVFYYSNAVLSEGKYLAPNLTNYLSEAFDDTVSRYIYTLQYAATSNTSVTGGSPVAFSGNMNAYRLNLSFINSLLANFGQPSDAGDNTAVDFTEQTCTLGGSGNYLDLSALVPAGTKYVLIVVQVTSMGGSYAILFFKNGNSNIFNRQYADRTGNVSLWVPLDATGKLGYIATIGSVFQIIICGYM